MQKSAIKTRFPQAQHELRKSQTIRILVDQKRALPLEKNPSFSEFVFDFSFFIWYQIRNYKLYLDSLQALLALYLTFSLNDSPRMPAPHNHNVTGIAPAPTGRWGEINYPKDPQIRPYGLIAWNELLWLCDSSQIRSYGLKRQSQSDVH